MKTTLIISVFAVIILAACILQIYTANTGLPAKAQAWVDKLRGAMRSKTIWFNTAALLFLQQLPSFVDYLAQNAPALQPFIPANHYQFVIGAITIANLILRFKTTQPLGAK